MRDGVRKRSSWTYYSCFTSCHLRPHITIFNCERKAHKIQRRLKLQKISSATVNTNCLPPVIYQLTHKAGDLTPISLVAYCEQSCLCDLLSRDIILLACGHDVCTALYLACVTRVHTEALCNWFFSIYTSISLVGYSTHNLQQK